MKTQNQKINRMRREIKKYKGIIKQEEDDEEYDLKLHKPEITPKKLSTIYGIFEIEQS